MRNSLWPPSRCRSKLPSAVLSKFHAPGYQFLYLVRRTFHHPGHRGRVAQPVAGNHGVVDVFVEIVDFKIRNGSDTALSERSIGLFESCLAHQGYPYAMSAGNLQRKTHSGDTRTYNQIIVTVSHCQCDYASAKLQILVIRRHKLCSITEETGDFARNRFDDSAKTSVFFGYRTFTRPVAL